MTLLWNFFFFLTIIGPEIGKFKDKNDRDQIKLDC